MLDIYCSECENLLAELNALMNAYAPAELNEAERTECKTKIKKKFDEIKECVDSLEFELRSIPPSERAEKGTNVAKLKGQAEEAKKNWLLKGSKRLGGEAVSKLEEAFATSNEKLGLSLQLAEETEQIASDVLRNLGSQRETIERAKSNAKKVSENLTVSNRVTAKMTSWMRTLF